MLVPDALSSLTQTTWSKNTATQCVPPAALVDFSCKRRGRDWERGTPSFTLQHAPNHSPSPSNQPWVLLPPTSLLYLISGCLISRAGSKKAKTIVSLLTLDPVPFANVINTFSNAPFRNLYYINGHHTLGSRLSVFFFEDLQSIRTPCAARCWGDSPRVWGGRNNMRGVWDTQTSAAVITETHGNSSVWSTRATNNADLLSRIYNMHAPGNFIFIVHEVYHNTEQLRN